MHQALAYVLMYISASFYCGFDTAIKEKALEHSYITQNSTFNANCEAVECLTKTLKLYDSKSGKLTEEGFLTITAVFSDFNSDVIDGMKKELNRCLPDVNQKINSLPIPKCSRFQLGASLLDNCIDKKKLAHISSSKN